VASFEFTVISKPGMKTPAQNFATLTPLPEGTEVVAHGYLGYLEL